MIPYGKHYIDEDDINAVVKTLRSSCLTQGPTIEEFEKAVCSYVGCEYAVAVSSATAALHLSMLALDICKESDVITSPITFVSSANAALFVEANVVFADIDINTINMTYQSLAKTIPMCQNPKVVIPVHIGGYPCEMTEIKTLADENNIYVVEDAAHAFGASYPNGKKVGCCENSTMTIFSFHPVKSIAAGEGGMITTNSADIYRKLLRLRSHGITKNNDSYINISNSQTDGLPNPWYYEMQELGYHYRITDIQCSLALSQLSKIDSFVSRRRFLAKKYFEAFRDNQYINIFQPFSEYSSYHLMILDINYEEIGYTRAKFMHLLRELGIGTQVHYIPLPMQPYYQRLGFDISNYPNALQYYNKCLSIPLFYGLLDSEQQHVIQGIKSLLPGVNS